MYIRESVTSFPNTANIAYTEMSDGIIYRVGLVEFCHVVWNPDFWHHTKKCRRAPVSGGTSMKSSHTAGTE